MKTKMMKTITSLLFSLLLLSTASCQEMRTVKVTVTEEDGTPIEGANTIVTFLGYGGQDTVRKKALTNAQGVSEIRGATSGRMSVRIEKKGYYTSQSGRLSRQKDHDITYALRRIKNPIPLYAKRTRIIAPVLGEKFAYDFELADWVAPHGKGKKSHCFFQMNTNIVSGDNHTQTLVVTFPNKADGGFPVNLKKVSEGSEFKWFYEAPQGEYIDKIVFSQYRKPKKPLLLEGCDMSYVLRINTQLDGAGNVCSANYVRIIKGLSFYGVLSKSPGVKFTYYFNPTPNDRNLEFDPTRNLFKDLDSTERVNEP